MTHPARARSYSNIAFIKYWGNKDDDLRIPMSGSISMNLAGVETVTSVAFDSELEADEMVFEGKPASDVVLERVSTHLDHFRALAGRREFARIDSGNNFPTGAGIASSASAFAALTAATAAALDLDLDEAVLSRYARRGSGSASRSIPGGFVEWYAGDSDETSFAEAIADKDHWDLVDLVAVVSQAHKNTGSTGGHALAPTSPLQTGRLKGADDRLKLCREAVLDRDFEKLADVVEHDALLMHAVMMTSQPSLIYWLPGTLELVHLTTQWRAQGIPVCFTIDAGPNVHLITDEEHADVIQTKLSELGTVLQILRAPVGGKTEILSNTPL